MWLNAIWARLKLIQANADSSLGHFCKQSAEWARWIACAWLQVNTAMRGKERKEGDFDPVCLVHTMTISLHGQYPYSSVKIFHWC